MTKYCCSGHTYDEFPDSYIMFEENIELPNIPNGFKLKKRKVKIIQ